MSARDLSASKCVKYSAFSEPFSTEKSIEKALSYLHGRQVGRTCVIGTKCNTGLGQEPLWLCSMYPPQAPSVLDVELRLLVLECDPVGVCVGVSGFLHSVLQSQACSASVSPTAVRPY